MKIFDIHSIEDVRDFVGFCCSKDINFHPDTDFVDYKNLSTGVPAFSKEESMYYNNVLIDCYTICQQTGNNIYKIGLEVLYAEV